MVAIREEITITIIILIICNKDKDSFNKSIAKIVTMTGLALRLNNNFAKVGSKTIKK